MGKMVPFVVSASLLGACDGVWDLEHIDEVECASPIGHDEDADGLDDACDPCPFDVDNSGDEDGDGIALACDPDPATKNEVVLFSGFETQQRTDFEVFDGFFTADSFDTTGRGPHGLYWTGNPDRIWLIAGVDVLEVHDDAYREVGFVFDATPSPTSEELNGIHCILGLSTKSYVDLFVRHRPDPDVTVHDMDVPLALDQLHGRVRAFYSRTGSTGCTFETPQLQPSVMGTPATQAAPGKVTLYADDTSVTFRFLFVTTKP